MLATNRLADRIGQPAIGALKEALAKPVNSWQQVHLMWVLHRLGALDEPSLSSAAADPRRKVRIHAMRILADIGEWNVGDRRLALSGLSDQDPTVSRCAADALGQHADPTDVRPLLEARARAAAADDPFLVHTLRIALRDHLAQTAPEKAVPLTGWSEQETAALADVAVGVPTPGAATFLLERLKKSNESNRDAISRALRHIARYLPSEKSDDLAEVVGSKFADDPDFQLELFKSMQEGVAQRGGEIGPGTRKWAGALRRKFSPNSRRARPAGLKARFPARTTRETPGMFDNAPARTA